MKCLSKEIGKQMDNREDRHEIWNSRLDVVIIKYQPKRPDTNSIILFLPIKFNPFIQISSDDPECQLKNFSIMSVEPVLKPTMLFLTFYYALINHSCYTWVNDSILFFSLQNWCFEWNKYQLSNWFISLLLFTFNTSNHLGFTIRYIPFTLRITWTTSIVTIKYGWFKSSATYFI